MLQVIFLDWWPVSRDCLMYAVSVISLIFTLQDGIVMWWEALLLVLFYIVYIAGKIQKLNAMYSLFNWEILVAVMYWNDIMSHKARTLMSKIRRQSRVRPYRERAEITPLLATSNGHKQNGKATVIELSDRLYPLVEENEGD